MGGAEAGTLTFMVGGPQDRFDAAQPFLQAMGKNIVHCGDVGTGQVGPLGMPLAFCVFILVRRRPAYLCDWVVRQCLYWTLCSRDFRAALVRSHVYLAYVSDRAFRVQLIDVLYNQLATTRA